MHGGRSLAVPAPGALAELPDLREALMLIVISMLWLTFVVGAVLQLLLCGPLAMATQISEGLQKVVLQQGTGQRPNRGDTITVQCTGMLHGDPPKKFWR
ncbi:hypothetical protein FJT64_015783 [Amphibalanus amphitrite]|uniref:Uncharacterized protein n=1 Tax=Amphibalanus amphitrite TaxID=1232801 RepID=A0A6A4X864_AMPAM|nr:hypothetical protein FJT64_015783 [Amphibalanus amphitrite]